MRPACLAIIAAVAKNGVIGCQGQLPWHLSEDLRHFKKLTMGHLIIMGRRTHESIGRLLPGRKTIILSTQPRFHVAGAIVAETFEEALCQASAEPIAFVVGGASVYRAALPHADRLYWTQIEADFEGDTYFPEVNWSEWQHVQRLAEAGPGASPFYWHIDRFDRYPPKRTAQQLFGKLARIGQAHVAGGE